MTNVRVNSTLTAQQVLNLLLNKFRVSFPYSVECHNLLLLVNSCSVQVEDKADEFGLYLVHESGGKPFHSLPYLIFKKSRLICRL